MPNQYTVNPQKVIDVSFYHYLYRQTVRVLSKKLRLNPKTIRRILKKSREKMIKDSDENNSYSLKN